MHTMQYEDRQHRRRGRVHGTGDARPRPSAPRTRARRRRVGLARRKARERNVPVHACLGINQTTVWRIIRNDLPALKVAVVEMLSELSIGKDLSPH